MHLASRTWLCFGNWIGEQPPNNQRDGNRQNGKCNQENDGVRRFIGVLAVAAKFPQV